MNDIQKDFQNLLDISEDYFSGGFRREHSKENSRQEELASLHAQIAACTQCRLHAARFNPVPGVGVFDPLVFIIGEGPGREEDRTGHPFIGKAGQYLDKWLTAVNLDRTQHCFIGNIVKCRPPENRDPLPDEAEACIPYLKNQIRLIKPKVILTLGRVASQIITGKKSGISSLRGTNYSYMDIPVVPTYHPSGVLRNPQYRSPVWDDLKRLRNIIDAGLPQ